WFVSSSLGLHPFADMSEIAIVGDLRWRDDMLIFLFADYRRSEARFFTEHERDKAKAWLVA
ncbi:MAG TPA: STAS/SEC14 domain-containing protein, partial [Candidatus Competibacteraceae bacterium]|nr:STAS/SEC14 domain-containing protein [Candidatus Competibacteraceae bacterium]